MIFKALSTGEELVLPVTPSEYTVEHGRSIESVEAYNVGVLNISGLAKLMNRNLDCMFPAQAYPFCNPGAVTDPEYYISKFRGYVDNKEILRYVVSDTDVNEQVVIENIVYGERDGTNDVYATITLRGYRDITAPERESTGAVPENSTRTESQADTQSTYTVVAGDTLWSIAKRFYGDGSLCYKLATYNDISNANLITVGQVIKLPARSELDAVKAASAASSSTGTQSTATVQQSATVPLRLTFSGTAAGKGRCTIQITTPDGKVSNRQYAGSSTIAVAKGSALIIKWYGEGGAKSDYYVLNGSRRTTTAATCGLTLRMTATQTLAIHWVN